jgi:hypothetical protein
MKRVPLWAQGALFAVAFALLIFFLKITCPIELGCFADPFLLPLLSPLIFVHYLGPLGSFEPFFILLFWCLVGMLIGFLFDKIWGNGRKIGDQ